MRFKKKEAEADLTLQGGICYQTQDLAPDVVFDYTGGGTGMSQCYTVFGDHYTYYS